MHAFYEILAQAHVLQEVQKHVLNLEVRYYEQNRELGGCRERAGAQSMLGQVSWEEGATGEEERDRSYTGYATGTRGRGHSDALPSILEE